MTVDRARLPSNHAKRTKKKILYTGMDSVFTAEKEAIVAKMEVKG